MDGVKPIGKAILDMIQECMDFSLIREMLKDDGYNEDEIDDAIDKLRKWLEAL